MNFVRERYTQLCLLSFAITSGFGLLLTLWPRLISTSLKIAPATAYSTFYARVLGLVLLAMGLAYLFALIYEEAKNPLLMLATIEKCLAVLYVSYALYRCQVHWPALGMIVVDLGIAIFGILAIRLTDESQI